MFYDIASIPWWLLAAALVGVVVGWVSYADIPRRGWFEGWAIWGAVAFVVGLVVAVLKLLPGKAGLWLEIALLVMFLYILGCFFGGWLKGLWLKPAQQRAEQAEQDRLAAAAAAAAEAERRAVAEKAEQDRLAAEAAAAVEAERRAAAEKAERDRLAAEAAAAVEAERRAAAEKAERDRLAAEAAAAVEAERRAAAEKAEQDRLAAAAAATAEAERRAAAEQDRLAAAAAAAAEAERRAAAEKVEQDRLAAAAAAAAEAERRAAAEKAEQDRLAAETAATAEADHLAAAVMEEHDRVATTVPGDGPPALAAPQGAADDLKLIRSVGPNNERTLNGLGVYHFSQIAGWSPDHAAWIGRQMAFPGRIERESWIAQAKLLEAGLDTDHSAGVKSGVIKINESADAPMSEAEARFLAAGLPALMPAVEGQQRHAGVRPLGLVAPRDGNPDDLKLIKGIGKQNEGRLHGLGIWHFDQIAAWSVENVKWVGSYLAFSGRIDRERWIAQAKDLAAGRKTAFARRVEAGLVATSRDDGSGGQFNIEKVEPKRD